MYSSDLIFSQSVERHLLDVIWRSVIPLGDLFLEEALHQVLREAGQARLLHSYVIFMLNQDVGEQCGVASYGTVVALRKTAVEHD